jgi:hypothetical protein
MKPQDPDDLKTPHRTIAALLAAFRRTWAELKKKEKEKK